jgi:hypothetical protein
MAMINKGINLNVMFFPGVPMLTGYFPRVKAVPCNHLAQFVNICSVAGQVAGWLYWMVVCSAATPLSFAACSLKN